MFWLSLHRTPVLKYRAFSLWNVPILFTQSIYQYFMSFHKFKWGKNFMIRCPSWHQPHMKMETSIFIATSSLGECKPRLKGNSPAHELGTIHYKASNWYFIVSRVTQYGDGAIVFIRLPSLGDCKPKLKSDSHIQFIQKLGCFWFYWSKS